MIRYVPIYKLDQARLERFWRKKSNTFIGNCLRVLEPKIWLRIISIYGAKFLWEDLSLEVITQQNVEILNSVPDLFQSWAWEAGSHLNLKLNHSNLRSLVRKAKPQEKPKKLITLVNLEMFWNVSRLHYGDHMELLEQIKVVKGFNLSFDFQASLYTNLVQFKKLQRNQWAILLLFYNTISYEQTPFSVGWTCMLLVQGFLFACMWHNKNANQCSQQYNSHLGIEFGISAHYNLQPW